MQVQDEYKSALHVIEWVKLVFPDVKRARAPKRERTRKSEVTLPEGKV